MVRALLLAVFLLSGCALQQPVEVYKNEYVLSEFTAQGPFNPYPRVEGDPVYPAGVYQIDAKGAYSLVGSLRTLSKPEIVPYDEKEDRCLTDFQGRSCSPNFKLSVNSDPYVDKLWGLKAPPGLNVEVLDIDRATPDVKVMVLDTGVACGHPDLECWDKAYNAITGSEEVADSFDGNGHGTHVAGTIGATGGNQVGIKGVSTSTEIVPGKFLGSNGSGSLFNAVKAIKWAIENGIDIVNASFGGGGYSQPFQDVVNEAAKAGVLVVAAAGNSRRDNDLRPHYPSNYKNVLAVASVDSQGNLSSFSNFGKETVDVAAPGTDIYSLKNTGGYKYLSGTSMATPHVAGLAALIYQRYKDLPRVERRELAIKEITSQTRKELRDRTKFGLVSAKKVLTEPTCKVRRCEKCRAECKEKYKCQCNKWQKCKKACRAQFSCEPGCKD